MSCGYPALARGSFWFFFFVSWMSECVQCKFVTQVLSSLFPLHGFGLKCSRFDLSISVNFNSVPESSGVELDVNPCAWPVDFPPVVLRTVEGAEATGMMDLASLWTSRAEAEQSGLTVKLSPQHAGLLGQLWPIARCMVARRQCVHQQMKFFRLCRVNNPGCGVHLHLFHVFGQAVQDCESFQMLAILSERRWRILDGRRNRNRRCSAQKSSDNQIPATGDSSESPGVHNVASMVEKLSLAQSSLVCSVSCVFRCSSRTSIYATAYCRQSIMECCIVVEYFCRSAHPCQPWIVGDAPQNSDTST